MEYKEVRVNEPVVDPYNIDAKTLVKIKDNGGFDVDGRTSAIQIRTSNGMFQGKAFYLSDRWDWVVGKDEKGMICLIPLNKERTY